MTVEFKLIKFICVLEYHFATHVRIYLFTKYLSEIKVDSYCNVLSWFWGVLSLLEGVLSRWSSCSFLASSQVAKCNFLARSIQSGLKHQNWYMCRLDHEH